MNALHPCRVHVFREHARETHAIGWADQEAQVTRGGNARRTGHQCANRDHATYQLDDDPRFCHRTCHALRCGAHGNSFRDGVQDALFEYPAQERLCHVIREVGHLVVGTTRVS